MLAALGTSDGNYWLKLAGRRKETNGPDSELENLITGHFLFLLFQKAVFQYGRSSVIQSSIAFSFEFQLS
jgi:hypothetical protein